MKPIEIKELKRVQLDIVQALHDFCLEHKIKYSLACGSLLGAIRHNGYIPWDDDIDVYLERDDFNRLIDLFPASYKGVYGLISLKTDKKWHIPYGKMYDNRTLMFENDIDWIPIGVNIDVYPVDRVPVDEKTWQKYNKVRRFIRDFIQYKSIRPSKRYSFLKNVIAFFVMIVFLFITKRFHAKIVNWYAQWFHHSGTATRLFENIQGIIQKAPFDKEDFSETILHKFEDRELCVMKGYDHCLRCGFGEYMQLPPIEKRVSHHSFKAYWKNNTGEEEKK